MKEPNELPDAVSIADIAGVAEFLRREGWQKVPDEDVPAGYASALVMPATSREGAVALAYVQPGHKPLLLITPREGHEKEDVETLLDVVCAVSLPALDDTREITADITPDVPDMPAGKVYAMGSFWKGRYYGCRNYNAESVASELLTMVAELPRWARTAIRRATRCAPEERYRVAYDALAECGHGEDARQELAHKVVRLAMALAVGQAQEGV